MTSIRGSLFSVKVEPLTDLHTSDVGMGYSKAKRGVSSIQMDGFGAKDEAACTAAPSTNLDLLMHLISVKDSVGGGVPSTTATNAAWHSSRGSGVGSQTSSLGTLSNRIKEHQAISFLGDLHRWRQSLDGPLNAALQFLVLCDPDVAEALLRTNSKLEALHEQAIKTVVSYANVAQQAYDTLPKLRSVNPDESAISTFTGWLSDAQDVARGLRASYVALLEDVYYILKCVEVGIEDSSGDEGQEKPQASTAASNRSSSTNSSEPSYCVPLALKHLNRARVILEDCSDAWLSIHSTERMLSQMTKDLKKISSGGSSTTRTNMQTLCSAVEAIYRLYCVPDSGPGKGKDAQRLAAWTS